MGNVPRGHRRAWTNASGYTLLEALISLAMVGIMGFSSLSVLSHVNRAQLQQNTTAQVATARNSLLYELDSPVTCLNRVFGAIVPGVGAVSGAVAAGGMELPAIGSLGNSRLQRAPEMRFTYTLKSFQIDPRSFAQPGGGGVQRRALGSLSVRGRHGGMADGPADRSELSVPIVFTFNQAMVFTGCSVEPRNFATQLNGGNRGAPGFPVRSSLECQGLGGAVFPTPERRLVCLIRNPNILTGNRDFYNNPPTAAGATACAQNGWVASGHVATSSIASVTPSCGGTVNSVTGSSFFSNIQPYGDIFDIQMRIKRGTQGFDWGAGVGVAALSVAVDVTIGGLLGPVGILGGIIAGLVCGKRCRDNRPVLHPLVVTEGCI